MEDLTSLYKDGKSFSTINSARSALSHYVKLVEDRNADFGKHALIVQFMKGVFKLRPALPRYNHTWDLSPVLQKMKTIDNESATLKDISFKCVTLIALTSSQRSQTIAAIKTDNLLFSHGDKVVIKFDVVLKTTRPNFQNIIELCSYKDDSRICPVSCLTVYLRRTKALRHSNNLFIALQKPHNSVTSQTLSRWISAFLRNCGIDEKFLAYSTRSASVSKAKRLNVNTDTILRTAGWSSDKTFAKFYNKPLSHEQFNQNQYINAILS